MCELDIFVWIGSLFGYAVQFFFNIFKNYGVAIILFTIATRLLLFPLNISQQKTMAAQQRIQPKINELKAKYGNDQQGLNMATQELHQKEGINPYSGCLPMLIQFPLLFGLYRAICKPLTCVLHLAEGAINSAAAAAEIVTDKNIYFEIDIIRKVAEGTLNTQFAEIFGDKFELVQEMSSGFRFLGLDLLQVASMKPLNGAVILAVLVFLAQVGSMIITNKINGAASSATPQGCNPNIMAVGFGLMSLFIAFSVPAALVLYWMISSLLGPAQTLLTKYLFGPLVMNAKAEAQRNAMIIADEKVIYDEVSARKGMLKLEPMAPRARDIKENNAGTQKKQSGKNKKKKR